MRRGSSWNLQATYHLPIVWALHEAEFYISVVNAMLVHDYKSNSLRKVKTDKKDAIKLASYGLDQWLALSKYVPEEDARLLFKNCYRQYQQYSYVQVMLKNNLISLLDTTFPDANRLFTTADIAVVEYSLGLVFKIDVEAEKFRKYINKQ